MKVVLLPHRKILMHVFSMTGLALQSCQIPLCFFMDELLNNKRIVLTGMKVFVSMYLGIKSCTMKFTQTTLFLVMNL